MSTATYDLHALIKEARRRASKRRWAYAGVLALLAGAGIWGGLALNGGSGSGAVAAPPAPAGYHLVRARGDVQHALVAFSYRGAVNGYAEGKLGAGQHYEVWLDPRAGLIRTRRCSLGRCSDEASRCVPNCTSVPLLERYWPVDTSKYVRRPGLGSFRGHHVIWLGVLQNTFAPAYRNGDWIALDPRTHDAVDERMYGTTDKPAGQVIGETWIVKRFPDIPGNRFWFPVKNRGLDVRFTSFHPVPLFVPGHEPTLGLRHATRIVVGRLARATIFAAPRRDGSWRLFSVGKDGTLDGAHRIDDPHTLLAGLVQVGHGDLFSSRAYLVVAGSMFARRDTKLFAVYADGSRQRIRLILTQKPDGPAAFHYYAVAPTEQVRGRRMTGLQLVRGSRVLSREIWPDLGYQAPEQPAPVPLKIALHVFGSSA